MCGRFVQARTAIALARDLGAEIADELPEPSFNIAPTQKISILLRRSKPELSGRELHAARWGFFPSWVRTGSAAAPLFNARIESVADKPSFRSALQRRCLIPISGYFEWQQQAGGKVPNYIYSQAGGLALAGLYQWWRDQSATDSQRWLLTATILTKASVNAISSIHDRMPVFINSELMDAWLDPNLVTNQELLDSAAAVADASTQGLSWHRVTAAVGSVKNNSEELISKID